MEKNELREVSNLYQAPCSLLYMDEKYLKSFGHLAPNSIIGSRFSKFEAELNPRVLGLKYVADGAETYLLKGKRYKIGGGKYLLVNEAARQMEVSIKNTTTWSLCVNIEPHFLNELLLQLEQPNNLDEINQVSRHLRTPELFVRETKASPGFRKHLDSLLHEVAQGRQSALPAEHIYELTTKLVAENLPVIKSYYKLQTARLSTRQELFYRLLKGKEMLDDSIFSEVTITEVADACCLSEFRFYRLFRQCFGVSPYNYLFRRRIEKGLELKKQNLTWNEIAHRLNFTDLAAFSKGFKKITGKAPTQFDLKTESHIFLN